MKNAFLLFMHRTFKRMQLLTCTTAQMFTRDVVQVATKAITQLVNCASKHVTKHVVLHLNKLNRKASVVT